MSLLLCSRRSRRFRKITTLGVAPRDPGSIRVGSEILITTASPLITNACLSYYVPGWQGSFQLHLWVWYGRLSGHVWSSLLDGCFTQCQHQHRDVSAGLLPPPHGGIGRGQCGAVSSVSYLSSAYLLSNKKKKMFPELHSGKLQGGKSYSHTRSDFFFFLRTIRAQARI